MRPGYLQKFAVASGGAIVLVLVVLLAGLSSARNRHPDNRTSEFNAPSRPISTVAHSPTLPQTKKAAHVTSRRRGVHFNVNQHSVAGGLTPADTANSLPTGTPITLDVETSGRGELEATNGTDLDSYVIVTKADIPLRVRQRYIKAKDSFTLDRLEPGKYRVLFATGIDWNSSEERFNRDASYFEFGRVLSFQESSDSKAVYYNHHSISINSAAHGNVIPKQLSEAEFHALSGRDRSSDVAVHQRLKPAFSNESSACPIAIPEVATPSCMIRAEEEQRR